jgi:hypothetical protein
LGAARAVVLRLDELQYPNDVTIIFGPTSQGRSMPGKYVNGDVVSLALSDGTIVPFGAPLLKVYTLGGEPVGVPGAFRCGSAM